MISQTSDIGSCLLKNMAALTWGRFLEVAIRKQVAHCGCHISTHHEKLAQNIKRNIYIQAELESISGFFKIVAAVKAVLLIQVILKPCELYLFGSLGSQAFDGLIKAVNDRLLVKSYIYIFLSLIQVKPIFLIEAVSGKKTWLDACS